MPPDLIGLRIKKNPRFLWGFGHPGTGPDFNLARPEGFEPPTNGFGSHYSIRLSYGRRVDPTRIAGRRRILTTKSPQVFPHSASSSRWGPPGPNWYPLRMSRLPRNPPAAGTPSRFGHYWKLMRADRPIGTLLLLWPTWWALWLAADGLPPLWTLFVFTAGVWLTRSAGCVINDYADRWLDPHVKRTKERPLATGAVSGREALALFAGLMLVAFALVLTMNALTIGLSFIGVFLAASYPYLKRYTHLPQVYLGMAFGWGIPMAFAAVQGEVPPLGWVLYGANILWSTAYDTWYAMVDRDDDLKVGSRSTAILFGELDLVIQGILYALFLGAMALVGQRAALGSAYWAALAVALAMVVYEFWLCRNREREPCFKAFLHNNWVGAVLFAGIVASQYLNR